MAEPTHTEPYRLPFEPLPLYENPTPSDMKKYREELKACQSANKGFIKAYKFCKELIGLDPDKLEKFFMSLKKDESNDQYHKFLICFKSMRRIKEACRQFSQIGSFISYNQVKPFKPQCFIENKNWDYRSKLNEILERKKTPDSEKLAHLFQEFIGKEGELNICEITLGQKEEFAKCHVSEKLNMFQSYFAYLHASRPIQSAMIEEIEKNKVKDKQYERWLHISVNTVWYQVVLKSDYIWFSKLYASGVARQFYYRILENETRVYPISIDDDFTHGQGIKLFNEIDQLFKEKCYLLAPKPGVWNFVGI